MNLKRRIILNAIKDGWAVKRNGKTYVFTKKHDNIKEYFEPAFLLNFIQKYK
jgi:hypothetical protein